jgi:hypothetical protein
MEAAMYLYLELCLWFLIGLFATRALYDMRALLLAGLKACLQTIATSSAPAVNFLPDCEHFRNRSNLSIPQFTPPTPLDPADPTDDSIGPSHHFLPSSSAYFAGPSSLKSSAPKASSIQLAKIMQSLR